MADEPPFDTTDRPGPVGPTDAARNPAESVGNSAVPDRGTAVEPPPVSQMSKRQAFALAHPFTGDQREMAPLRRVRDLGGRLWSTTILAVDR